MTSSRQHIFEHHVKISGNLRVLSILLLGLACAVLTWSAVWIAYPLAHREWNIERITFACLSVLGPVMTGVNSLHALTDRTARGGSYPEVQIGPFILTMVLVALLAESLFRLTDEGLAGSDTIIPSLIGGTVIAAVLAVGALRLTLPRPTFDPKREVLLHRVIAVSVFVPIVAALVWSAWIGALVA